jgi:hypothetical protein
VSRWTLSVPSQDITYRLSASDIPLGGPPATDEERLDAVRDGFSSQPGTKSQLLHEGRISENGVPGRFLELVVGEKYKSQLKVFILKARIYQIMVVRPRNAEEDDSMKRFLSSFRFEKSKE